MITIRVSRLEAFRRVVATAYGSEDDLIRDIRGEPVPPNDFMLAGTAFHELLERGLPYPPRDGDDYPIERNGWTFEATAVDRVNARQGPGLREVTGFRAFRDAQVQGTCDHVRGLFIRDTKCKFSTIDAKAYEPSLQWRMYLAIHEADCFTYDLLDFKEDNHVCKLRDIVSVRFWRYPGLEAECEEWVSQFVAWAKSRNLLGYLQGKERAA